MNEYENDSHVVSYWKYKLKDVIGFEFQLNEGRNICKGNRDEIINYFFEIWFTPEAMIDHLQGIIKGEKGMLLEVCSVIREHLNIEDDKDLKDYLELDDPTDIYSLKGINKLGMMIILQKYNLISINY